MQMTLIVVTLFISVLAASAAVSQKFSEDFDDGDVADASVDKAVKKSDTNSVDVIPFQVGSKRYLFVLRKASWEESEGYCKSQGMHLATIPSSRIQNRIASKIRSDPRLTPDEFWIGARSLSNPYEWMWICGFEKVAYTKWNSGEPNDGAPGPEYCVQLIRDRSLWNNGSCNVNMSSICGNCEH